MQSNVKKIFYTLTHILVGLVAYLVSKLTNLYSTLCTETFQHSAKEVTESLELRWEALKSDCIATLNLLRNFLYNSSAVKSEAVSANLANLIAKMWNYCINQETIMSSLLGNTQCPLFIININCRSAN